nr:MAG TPA: hypothetical protein [Caudoviricetes sp.]
MEYLSYNQKSTTARSRYPVIVLFCLIFLVYSQGSIHKLSKVILSEQYN